MHPQLPLVLFLAFGWGLAVALFMQYTEIGDFLSKHMTWFITSVGSGGVLLLTMFLIDEQWQIVWWYVPAAFFVASLGPAFRGIWHHKAYFMDWIHNARHNPITE